MKQMFFQSSVASGVEYDELDEEYEALKSIVLPKLAEKMSSLHVFQPKGSASELNSQIFINKGVPDSDFEELFFPNLDPEARKEFKEILLMMDNKSSPKIEVIGKVLACFKIQLNIFI